MGLAMEVVLSLGSGYLLSIIFWPRRQSSAFEVLYCIFLALGFAVGLSSIVLVFARAFSVDHLIALDISFFALLAASYIIIRPRKSIRTLQSEIIGQNEQNWLDRVLVSSFVIVTAAALYSTVLRCIAHPHGEGWDAFSIWNLHARFLFRGGTAWRDGFTSIIPWSHPDYPLLLPGAITHLWIYLGQESQAVPAIMGFAFTFGTAGLLFSSVAIIRGNRAALLATTALLSTPFFVEQGPSQYADVPLSFFYLAAISLLVLHDYFSDASNVRSGSLIALAGVAAGFAAWTKNEGLLFLFALVFGRGVILIRSRITNLKPPRNKWRTAIPMLAGMLPVLLLIVWFKHFIAPPGDLFPDLSTAIHKLGDASRYRITFDWYWKEFFRFGDWLLIPATVAMPFLFIPIRKITEFQFRPGLQTAVITIGFTLAGYFAIYVITPHDLLWHLRNSLARLFLQVWPSAIFICFTLLPGLVGKFGGSSAVSK